MLMMSNLNDLLCKVFYKNSVPTMIVGIGNCMYGEINSEKIENKKTAINITYKIIHANYSLQKLFKIELNKIDNYHEYDIFNNFMKDLCQNINYYLFLILVTS